MRAAMPKPATSISNREAVTAPTVHLVVDNSRADDGRANSAETSVRPLPWAICLAIWVVLAAAGWAAIGRLLQMM
jgi:hypothetical protein